MKRKSSKSNVAVIVLVIAIIIAAGVLVYVLASNSGDKKEEPAKKVEKEVVKSDINPLTGLKLTGDELTRPFIVSTGNDNAAARPQSGLSQADIMYEVPIEGGGSRYEPIYYSQQPGLVGEIRSIRPYIINIAREYKAVLVHNGKSPQAKKLFHTIDRLSTAGHFDIFHHEDRPPEGNFFSSGDLIVKRMKKRGFYKPQELRTFQWLEKDAAPEGKDMKDATNITVNYADFTYNTFKYDPETKLYTKYVNDETMIDYNNQKAITCANILVQEVPFKTYDEQRLNIDMTKGGKATMFTQGKVVKGKWSRKDLDSPTIFSDGDGKEFKMTPGNTWVQLIDSTVKFEYK